MLTVSYPGAAPAAECRRAARIIARCARPRSTSPLLARRLGARSAAAAGLLATLSSSPLSKRPPLPLPSASEASVSRAART